jgi:light-regulated signal transduction histidine kinase (bacteriophytochrome)
VKTLDNAEQLFDVLAIFEPDLILLDIMMPEISGYDLCSEIKQEERFSKIPVIFLTSLNDTASIIKCFSVGAADYLSKPVNTQELFARIETHINLQINTAKLQAAERELDNFNQMISHDLKSPILMVNKLAGYLIEYQGKVDDPDFDEIINGIRQKSEEVAYVMSKYSELSRLSYIKLNAELVDLNILIQEIISELTNSSNAVIETSDLPVIWGDRLLMKRALANIVSNAFKFTQGRNPARICIGYNCSDYGYLIFVKDNGVGFNPEYGDRLFKMFSRLHSSKDFEGTGTGLAIVKKIIELHNGTVWIEGKENEGASAYIELPKLIEDRASF